MQGNIPGKKQAKATAVLSNASLVFIFSGGLRISLLFKVVVGVQLFVN